jgi:hypothetical protein
VSHFSNPVTATHELVQRTQRAVRTQTIVMAESKERNRRGIGVAALIISVVLVALTPAAWIGLNWLAEWGSMAEAESQSAYILICSLPLAFMLGIIGYWWHRKNRSEHLS